MENECELSEPKTKPERKRKTISPSMKLRVLVRDNYTCRSCGKNPITNPGLPLDVDHTLPFSKGGSCTFDNYEIKCASCNRGKGNNSELNRTIKNDLDMLLDHINPEIRRELTLQKRVSVVANQEDFIKLMSLNSYDDFYIIEPTTNTIIGYQTGKNFGIYTVRDNHSTKTHFYLTPIQQLSATEPRD